MRQLERALPESRARPRVHLRGVFRQHMIVKDRNRDTAWYSLLDREWPGVKARLEAAVLAP